MARNPPRESSTHAANSRGRNSHPARPSTSAHRRNKVTEPPVLQPADVGEQMKRRERLVRPAGDEERPQWIGLRLCQELLRTSLALLVVDALADLVLNLRLLEIDDQHRASTKRVRRCGAVDRDVARLGQRTA